MAQELINIGANADDGTGDTIRNAGRKINANFTEFFALPVVASDIRFEQNNIVSKSSNADIVLKPSGTGNIVFPALTVEDNNIKLTRSNDDLKITANGSGKVVIDGIGFAGTSIVATDSSTVNINENLIVDGTVNTGAATLDSAVTINSTLGVDGVSTLSTLTVTGASSFVGTTTIDNLTFNDNIIATASNADLNITPGGTGSVVLPGITIDDNNITGTRSNEDLNITASGSGDVLLGPIRITGTTLDSADSTTININDAVIVDGTITANTPTFNGAVIANSTLDVTSDTTLSTLTVSGASSFVGTTTIDNLSFNDNIITTSSNADLNLSPGGTGVVNVSNLTIDSSISLTDNVIKVTRSDDDFVLSANGTGSVQVSKIDMNEGTVDNVVIGGTTPAAGTFTSLAFTGTSIEADGVTVTDNTITANRSNDNLELEASGSGYVRFNDVLNFPNSDGNTGQLLRTDGSGQLSWFTSPVLFGVSSVQDASKTISFATLTEIDHVTAVGGHNRIESGTVVQDSWATSKYDSAWYLAVNRDDASDEFEVTKHSVVHNNSTAFVTNSIEAKTGTNNHVITTADISSGSVRLLGTGSSPENSVSFYRIGLGDDDSTGYSGEDEAAVVINTDVDSASEVIDSFAHGSFRGAKYYISVNNATKTECSNIECSVVHDGTTAFITTYNVVNTGNNDLVTLTAAINGSNVEVSAAGLEPNLRVHAYRIILADNEADRSSTNINVIGNVTVSSATTTLDTFSTGSYQAAHYVIVSHNASEGHSAICEAAVVSDGTNAYVVQYGLNSTKGTDQILLTVGHAGSTTTLSATSTSGGSTTVNAYRVSLTRGAGTSSASATIDSISATDFRSAKYNVQVADVTGGNFELFEANVTHDGSTAYISIFGNVGTSTELITMTADIDSGNLRLLGTINNTNDHVVKVVRRVINV